MDKKRFGRSLAYYRRTFSRRVLDNHSKPLIPHLRGFIGGEKFYRIADIGAGPICEIGNYIKNKDIEVIASDICAPEYNSMWEDQEPYIPVEYQDMENLTYEDNYFDVVHCCNAIDHTPNAMKALGEIERVCKKGGWIYLNHLRNQRSQLGGHHSWDIDIECDITLLVKNNHRHLLERPTLRMGNNILTVWQKT